MYAVRKTAEGFVVGPTVTWYKSVGLPAPANAPSVGLLTASSSSASSTTPTPEPTKVVAQPPKAAAFDVPDWLPAHKREGWLKRQRCEHQLRMMKQAFDAGDRVFVHVRVKCNTGRVRAIYERLPSAVPMRLDWLLPDAVGLPSITLEIVEPLGWWITHGFRTPVFHELVPDQKHASRNYVHFKTKSLTKFYILAGTMEDRTVDVPGLPDGWNPLCAKWNILRDPWTTDTLCAAAATQALVTRAVQRLAPSELPQSVAPIIPMILALLDWRKPKSEERARRFLTSKFANSPSAVTDTPASLGMHSSSIYHRKRKRDTF